jgi:hypothetical protein
MDFLASVSWIFFGSIFFLAYWAIFLVEEGGGGLFESFVPLLVPDLEIHEVMDPDESKSGTQVDTNLIF